MLVISRTRYRRAQQCASLLTHADVLAMLLVAAGLSTACVLHMAVGPAARDCRAFFLVQLTFCVFAYPTLALAVRVPPSAFFGGFAAAPGAGLLLPCVFVVVAAEALFFCWRFL